MKNTEGAFSKSNAILIIVAIVILVILAIFYILGNYSEEEESIGEQTDQYGCLKSVGDQWCATLQKCIRIEDEFCASLEENNVVDVLSRLNSVTLIGFSEPQRIEFNWLVEDEENIGDVLISGLIVTAKDVNYTQPVFDFFENEGFEADRYNIADGTIGGLSGYQSGNVICTVTNVSSGMQIEDPDEDSAPILHDIDIKCGVLDPSKLPIVSTKKKIQKLIAAMYDKKVSQVEVIIEQETEYHARGGVTFLPKDRGESGVFMASNINGEWEIVFDGNGSIPCSLLDEFQFPDSMKDQCFTG